MINSIIFDLDGVLVETRQMHFDTLNQALYDNKFFPVQKKVHDHFLNGLPTVQKLDILMDEFDYVFSFEERDRITKRKKELTVKWLCDNLKENPELIELFKKLRAKEYKIGVASNAIRNTVTLCLNSIGVMKYVNFYLCNEDVKNPKPNPEIYQKMAEELRVKPEEMLVFEDNQHGVQSAISAGCDVEKVNSPEGVLGHDRIMELVKPDKPKDINIVIPMAGEGSRFQKQGYTYPKPLVAIGNKPMIQVVYDTLPKVADEVNNVIFDYTFIVKKEHITKYDIRRMLQRMSPYSSLHSLNNTTEGALCTVLKASAMIDNDNPLIIANSDQYVEIDWNLFHQEIVMNEKIDGALFTFNSIHPKFSFVEIEDGEVTCVSEKLVTSNHATCGIYYFRRGSDFVKYAVQMIMNNDRVNEEFYIAPVYNYLIKDGKIIKPYFVDTMLSLGTPEDLNYFLQSNEYTRYRETFGS